MEMVAEPPPASEGRCAASEEKMGATSMSRLAEAVEVDWYPSSPPLCVLPRRLSPGVVCPSRRFHRATAAALLSSSKTVESCS